MARLKAIQLSINSALPPELQNYARALDAKDIGDVLAAVARDHPDDYAKIAKKIADVGRHAAYEQGVTITLDDLDTKFDKRAIVKAMNQEVQQAKKTFGADQDGYQQAREAIWQRYIGIIQDQTMITGKQHNTGIYQSVASGARGNPSQMRMMVGAPGLFTDANDKSVPVFIANSFSDGLRPGEFLASTYGARKSTLSTKTATARGGFFLKQLVQSAVPLVVTEEDCGTTNGIDVQTDNFKSMRGRVLAGDYAGIKTGAIVDRHAAALLNRKKIDTVLVRSPLTCQAREGVCAKCTGADPRGRFYPIGEAVGVTAAQGIGEPICLEENTLVRMADWTERKIRDIKVGEWVLGSDMNGHLRPVRVKNVFHNGMRDCWKTRIRKGRGAKSEVVELVSTREHKVLSAKGRRIGAPSILPICAPPKWMRHSVFMSKGVSAEVGVSVPHAALLGVLLGDGCYNGGVGSKGLALSCYDLELENWVRGYLSGIGLNLRPMSSGEFRLSMQDQYNSFETINGALVRNTVKAILLHEGMWGQGSGTKILPASIEAWDNRSVAALIGGLIATDGWITNCGKSCGVVGIGSNSMELLRGVKRLLEIRFGIYSNRITSKRKKKKTGGAYAPNHTLTISCAPDVRELAERIPIPGCKQARLLQSVSSSTATIACERGRFVVLSQTRIGEMDTWDIEVENDTHLFALANSLIVSNTQNALNVKHQGGVSSGKSRRTFSGMDVMEQFVQIPDEFPFRAAVSEREGKVDRIEAAPQGGQYVFVDGESHYVPADSLPIVKPGQMVELGEPLSDGLMSPADVVRLRGLGEGRRYYAERLGQILADSGMPADPRSVEMVTRSALDDVQVDDPDEMDDGIMPDDIVSYNRVSSSYVPPKDAVQIPIAKAHGMVLHEPKLHFSIGTSLTGKMLDRMKKSGVQTVLASRQPAPFSPSMSRLQTSTHGRDDWLGSQHTSYLTRQLADHAERGADTTVHGNVHFAPALAYGEGFGEKVRETGKF